MEKNIQFQNNQEAQALFGKYDENIKLIEDSLGVKIVGRGEAVTIIGEDPEVEKAVSLFTELLAVVRKGGIVRKHELLFALRTVKEGKSSQLREIYLDRIEVSSKRHYITPQTKGQKEYIDAIRKYDIVFCIGPAGTGKTYLAMAMAVNALQNQDVSRIILVRPAVEAGESLGYLPGDIYEKVSPYLRPLYDALYDMMEVEKIERYMERGIIEVVPLAYMRGRTLNDSFIILDEAQNSTPEQMKMFLTRLGFDSKAVITGDITQSDLPLGKESGLIQAQYVLKDIEGIRFVVLTGEDVVRHELVQEIIKAYARFESSRNQ
ncbi:MAG: PhoH family protein [Candidatus Omnitrophica bacterium]|nr:PhoH family protein [Candidatus Omnitrophota bacterium]MCM8792904.1 PhoH family protein [Candidatus Omnitrophota bacterium]